MSDIHLVDAYADAWDACSRVFLFVPRSYLRGHVLRADSKARMKHSGPN